MASVYKTGKTWTVAWMSSTGRRQYARGLPSKHIANMIAESREFNAHSAKHGVISRVAEKSAAENDRPINKHIEDFASTLKGKGNTAQHNRESVSLVKRIMVAAGISLLSQLDRFPIVRECNALMDAGRSRRTRNKALGACKTFISWLRKHDRIQVNVLEGEDQLDEAQDRRRIRRALTEAQTLTLIETTATQPTRGGMTGLDRMMRYALGIGTGFRQSTLFKLRPGDFHLDDEGGPFIHVIATNVKNRKEFDQPIRADLADLFRPWLASKPPKRVVFTKLKGAKPIIAYRHDLKAAGIEYHHDGTVEFCDQHAQRNTFITSVIRVAGLKVAQDLAHHSTPDLTSKYGRMEMTDYRKALDGMPPMKAPRKAEKKIS